MAVSLSFFMCFYRSSYEIAKFNDLNIVNLSPTTTVDSTFVMILGVQTNSDQNNCVEQLVDSAKECIL